MYRMIIHAIARTLVKAALVVCMLLLPAAAASASELVMFEQAGCIYCQRWDRSVGSLYDKTDEARMLPLRRVDIRDQKMSGVALASPVRFTPTFVVVDNGREIGRITGYSNDDAFWGLLDTLVAKLAPSPQVNRT